jgi:hypothetical protein
MNLVFVHTDPLIIVPSGGRARVAGLGAPGVAHRPIQRVGRGVSRPILRVGTVVIG